jgi:hypothetical protein
MLVVSGEPLCFVKLLPICTGLKQRRFGISMFMGPRKIGVESGWTVCVCNDISEAVLPVDLDYYVREVEKITNCLS